MSMEDILQRAELHGAVALAPEGVAISTPEPKATEVMFDMDHCSQRAANLAFKASTAARSID